MVFESGTANIIFMNDTVLDNPKSTSQGTNWCKDELGEQHNGNGVICVDLKSW